MRPDDAFASTRIERARGHYPSLCESLSALSRRLYVSRLSAVLNGMTLALNLVLCLWLVASEGRPAQEGVFLTLEGLVTASLLGELVRRFFWGSQFICAAARSTALGHESAFVWRERQRLGLAVNAHGGAPRCYANSPVSQQTLAYVRVGSPRQFCADGANVFDCFVLVICVTSLGASRLCQISPPNASRRARGRRPRQLPRRRRPLCTCAARASPSLTRVFTGALFGAMPSLMRANPAPPSKRRRRPARAHVRARARAFSGNCRLLAGRATCSFWCSTRTKSRRWEPTCTLRSAEAARTRRARGRVARCVRACVRVLTAVWHGRMPLRASKWRSFPATAATTAAAATAPRLSRFCV